MVPWGAATEGAPKYANASKLRRYLRPYGSRAGPVRVSGSGGAEAEAGATLAKPSANLSGVWRKDWGASDPMDGPGGAAETMELNFLLRQALKLVSTLEVRHGERSFETVLKAGVLDVSEKYPLPEEGGELGDERVFGRRDRRAGHARGRARRDTTAGGVAVELAWDGELAGSQTETFALADDGSVEPALHVDTDMVLDNGRTCKYRTVYRRA